MTRKQLTHSQTQERRRWAYIRHLAKCGFTSWKQANGRRCDLADLKAHDVATTAELREFEQLQKLHELWWKWKSNDREGRALRQLDRKLAKARIPKA